MNSAYAISHNLSEGDSRRFEKLSLEAGATTTSQSAVTITNFSDLKELRESAVDPVRLEQFRIADAILDLINEINSGTRREINVTVRNEQGVTNPEEIFWLQVSDYSKPA